MIRDFKPQDMDSVLSIWLEASVKAHAFVDRHFWEARVEDIRNIYIPDSETYVFEEEETVKGFVSLDGNSLAAIFVSPESQGRGIGRQLMDKAKSLREKLNLTVYKENRKSVRFYEKNGFIHVGERVDTYTGHTEIVMEYGR
jgi:putative acetyltransferase